MALDGGLALAGTRRTEFCTMLLRQLRALTYSRRSNFRNYAHQPIWFVGRCFCACGCAFVFAAVSVCECEWKCICIINHSRSTYLSTAVHITMFIHSRRKNEKAYMHLTLFDYVNILYHYNNYNNKKDHTRYNTHRITTYGNELSDGLNLCVWKFKTHGM